MKELDMIRDWAWAKRQPSPALVGAVLSRIAAMVPPSVGVDAGLGPASLNLVVCLLGPSGAGKDQAITAARDMYPDPRLHVVTPSSGEAIPEAYFGMVEEDTGRVDRQGHAVTERVKAQVRQNVWFVATEAEGLLATAERRGSTLMTHLRQAWTGSFLGTAAADSTRTRMLAPGSYSAGVVLGVQPEIAGPLLADLRGTAQRLLWLPSVDADIPDDPAAWLPDLPALRWPSGGTIVADPPIRAEVRRERLLRARGTWDGPAEDAHRTLGRLKVAGLLAVLSGQDRVDDRLWGAAGDWVDTSCETRRTAWEASRDAAAIRESEDADMAATRAAKAQLARVGAEDRIARIGALLVRHVPALPDRIAESHLAQKLPNRDRPLMDDALERAILAHLLVRLDGFVYAGPAVVPEQGSGRSGQDQDKDMPWGAAR